MRPDAGTAPGTQAGAGSTVAVQEADDGGTGARADVGPGAPAAERVADGAFQVHLDVFDGPFDLLLSLISQHKLDVTQVALAEVTDDFLAYIHAAAEWDLSVASDFLVVAATLLDLKALRLLPQTGEEDPEDLALLEARDLLFARLLAYRAFKEVAGLFGRRLAEQSARAPRAVPLEPQFAGLLPELVWTLGAAELAAIAADVLSRPPKPTEVDTEHLHYAPVSVTEQAAIVSARLRRRHTASFRELVSDAAERAVVVARFLSLLELYKAGAVAFEQVTPLGELTIRWVSDAESDVDVADEYEGEA
jgi:segregation and condensation protein A